MELFNTSAQWAINCVVKIIKDNIKRICKKVKVLQKSKDIAKCKDIAN